MKLFEVVPSELFSVLASPNRILYADALEVLYNAYRENLKIPEETFYSMLRAKMERQLAEATFDGEDIDEEELRDISGRARFLIRKLCNKGWFEKNAAMILTSTLLFRDIAADCWSFFISCGMTVPYGGIPMCLAPTLR